MSRTRTRTAVVFGDGLGCVTSQVEVIPRPSKRLVEVVNDLISPRAKRCIVIVGGTCTQPQTQLHRQTSLEQEDGLVVLITRPVEYSGDDHGVQPALQPRRRHASVGGMVADEPLQVTDITRQLLDAVSHWEPPATAGALRPAASRLAR